MAFYRERFFGPLGMRSPVDVDHKPWSAEDPLGYNQFALGAQRAVAPEGGGWMWGAGGLAMTAEDLARWNISLMNGAVLKPASMNALTTEVKLKDGSATGYALGMGVSNADGRRKWSHGGGASGFDSANATWPDDRVALTVLTNGETRAHQTIMQRVGEMLAPSQLELAKRMFRDLQEGKVDRRLLTEEASGYFTVQALADFAASLKPLGTATAFKQRSAQERGGMTHRVFDVTVGGKSLRLSSYWTPEGKVMQYLITLAPGDN